MRAEYLTCCVNSDADSIIAMTDAARRITWKTFARRVRWREWAASMGYDKHLHPSEDYAVSFHKSHYQGQPCYYVDHSRIEYIFVRPHGNGLRRNRKTSADRYNLY